jgi:hypothetical protein
MHCKGHAKKAGYKTPSNQGCMDLRVVKADKNGTFLFQDGIIISIQKTKPRLAKKQASLYFRDFPILDTGFCRYDSFSLRASYCR